MTARLLLILISAFLILQPGAGQAQDDEPPSVALLSFGTSPAAWSVTEQAILLMLRDNGFISSDDFNPERRGDIEGEGVRVFAQDANWELDKLNLMIETAIDRGADALIAFTTPVAQAAVNATLDMEDPPIVIFASVYYPYEAGLAEASCIKPAHVAGSQILPPYASLLSALRRQSPDLTKIGIIYSLDQVAGARGAQTIAKLAEAQGLEIAEIGVVAPIDLNLAVEGLASKGAEALVMPIDTITSRGLPNVASVASEYGIPVYYPSLGAVQGGAMITSGYYRQMDQGLNIARILIAWLNGSLDIAGTAIDSVSGDAIGLNLDVADVLGVEIAQELIDAADVVISDGQVSLSPRLQDLAKELSEYLAAEDRDDIDQQYLESLRCTPERIAEQQAALDAAEE